MGGRTRVDPGAGGDHDDVAVGRGWNELLNDEGALQLDRRVVGRLRVRSVTMGRDDKQKEKKEKRFRLLYPFLGPRLYRPQEEREERHSSSLHK